MWVDVPRICSKIFPSSIFLRKMPNLATSIFISAPDGLRLHALSRGRRSTSALPVVCLPGLARTAADFDALADALANDPPSLRFGGQVSKPAIAAYSAEAAASAAKAGLAAAGAARPRRVIALDYRGRGQSDYDRDPARYNFQVELADVLAVITALDALPAIFIGTSRGGILAMLLAAMRPSAIAGAVLNDIGPVIEPKGLMRIKGYVGKLPQPRSFEEGAEILRRLFDAQFPKLTPQDWLASARRTFRRENGALVPTYDIKLVKTLEGVDFEKPFPPLWAQFDALASVPVMVIRGENSDVLSPATVEAMRARRATLETIEVPDQGHAPLLAEPDIIARIAAFAVGCDSL
jgi:pimeloyl-ACP methyl ester carboxylesterase